MMGAQEGHGYTQLYVCFSQAAREIVEMAAADYICPMSPSRRGGVKHRARQIGERNRHLVSMRKEKAGLPSKAIY